MASRGLGRRLYDLERRWRAYYNVAPDTPETARRAQVYMRWFDHEVLRHVWTNQAEVAPGVLRSNHPTAARLTRLAEGGLRSVLTLRGSAQSAHYLTEKALCETLGLSFHALGFSDKHAPTKEALLALIDLFPHLERPFLMHCKSGADRAGLAAAIYLMTQERRSVAEAKSMLSARFLHFKGSKAGELDRVLAGYERDGAGLGFEDWVRAGYDPATLPRR